MNSDQAVDLVTFSLKEMRLPKGVSLRVLPCGRGVEVHFDYVLNRAFVLTDASLVGCSTRSLFALVNGCRTESLEQMATEAVENFRRFLPKRHDKPAVNHDLRLGCFSVRSDELPAEAAA